MSRTVYLIHFNRPFSHARHYLGSTDNLERRLREHREGNGAKLMAAISQAGIPWTLARTWQGDRACERRLKRQKNSPRLCPICSAGAHRRTRAPACDTAERADVCRSERKANDNEPI